MWKTSFTLMQSYRYIFTFSDRLKDKIILLKFVCSLIGISHVCKFMKYTLMYRGCHVPCKSCFSRMTMQHILGCDKVYYFDPQTSLCTTSCQRHTQYLGSFTICYECLNQLINHVLDHSSQFYGFKDPRPNVLQNSVRDTRCSGFFQDIKIWHFWHCI